MSSLVDNVTYSCKDKLMLSTNFNWTLLASFVAAMIAIALAWRPQALRTALDIAIFHRFGDNANSSHLRLLIRLRCCRGLPPEKPA
jgi:hypothetical protein